MPEVTCRWRGLIYAKKYAPVVQWMTVRLILILEFLLRIKSKQCNVTSAFIHSDLGKDDKIFVDMPRGFEVKGKNGRTKVLKPFKNVYKLHQTPSAFWKYMTPKMELCGMVQSNMDPCLFFI